MIVVAGVLGGGIWTRSRLPPAARPTLWLNSELPLDEVPGELIADIRRATKVLVVEEHVAQGGLGQILWRAGFSNGD